MKITEFIFSSLETAGKDGLSFKSLAKKCSAVSYQEKQMLEDVLNELEKQKAIIELGSRYYLPQNTSLIEGKIKRHERGFAFLIREDGEADLFIPPKYLNGAYQGDRVLVKRLFSSSGSSDEAEVVKILQRGISRISGVYYAQKGYAFVEPDDSSFGSDVYIAKGHGLNAKTGQKVAVKIVAYPPNGSPEGFVTDILGNPFDIKAQVNGVLISNDVPNEFPSEVIKEVQKIPEEINADEYLYREDFTSLLTFTIDGEDARDFDDAISIYKENNQYVLYVHIADVSAYVKIGSKTDKEAYKRGTSIYIPGKVFPMLPEKLSNNLCSLNPKVDRLAVTVKMCFNEKGDLIDKSFYKSIINSNYRLTYNKVQAIYDGNKELIKEYSEIVSSLLLSRELKNLMLLGREKRGMVDLDVDECRISFVEGKLVVARRESIESERVIEQFMISANVAVAEFLYYSELPLIYRTHGKPDPEKVSAFKAFLRGCGLKVPQKLEYPMDFQKVLKELENSDIKGVVSDVMLRSMQKAIYSNENTGHFGLNEKCYCHFTSPIRRYPDLVAHRILKGVIEGQAPEIDNYYATKCAEIACSNSESEKKADKIEREIDDLYVCKFMEQFIGDYFEGIISGVTSFGVFVRLENCAEGLIPLEDLPKGKYEFHQENYTLKSTKHSFKLGERVVVKLTGTSYERARVYFSFVQKI